MIIDNNTSIVITILILVGVLKTLIKLIIDNNTSIVITILILVGVLKTLIKMIIDNNTSIVITILILVGVPKTRLQFHKSHHGFGRIKSGRTQKCTARVNAKCLRFKDRVRQNP